ncbi:protein CDV3 homolog isoform X2 [Macrobrachium rosenbergii]|uniref:protein CDV3 homolog isoform X2 n=1 Tax=Macrobrachium rosenbergii TaxID=79674 RepID=UPI0034D40D8C
MSDLDSFFAKKDKKKVKGKKFTTSDEIARRLEESEKKDQIQVLKSKVEPVRKLEESSEDSPVVEDPPQKLLDLDLPLSVIKKGKPRPKNYLQEEEEWNDFEDDKDKDLTNLKINKLQIEDEEDLGGGSADDDGEKGEHWDKRDGVWKTESIQPAPAPVTTIEPEEKGRPTINSSYVPPHMRNTSASPLPKSTPRRNKTAPDINNEMAFPSLSDAQASNPMGAWGKKRFNNEGFESVRHGSTRVMAEDHAPPKLSTANRFDALSDNS